jgi:hypothetical protein
MICGKRYDSSLCFIIPIPKYHPVSFLTHQFLFLNTQARRDVFFYLDQTRDARMKSNKDGHQAWVNLLQSIYGVEHNASYAPLRGCRGSFKDYVTRLCKENALMPNDKQYQSLLVEADALDKLSSKKELSKIAVSAKKQMAQDFTSIEVKLGLLESGVGSSNEAPVIIDDTPLPTVRDRKRQRAQMMCGNGNIIGDSAKLVDKVDECFGFIKDQFRGKENEKMTWT